MMVANVRRIARPSARDLDPEITGECATYYAQREDVRDLRLAAMPNGRSSPRTWCQRKYPACTRTKSQGSTQSASNPKLITHLADFSVQEVNFEPSFIIIPTH
jgi:hypothetical protein